MFNQGNQLGGCCSSVGGLNLGLCVIQGMVWDGLEGADFHHVGA